MSVEQKGLEGREQGATPAAEALEEETPPGKASGEACWSLLCPLRPHSLSPYTPFPMFMMAADLFSRIVLFRKACGLNRGGGRQANNLVNRPTQEAHAVARDQNLPRALHKELQHGC